MALGLPKRSFVNKKPQQAIDVSAYRPIKRAYEKAQLFSSASRARKEADQASSIGTIAKETAKGVVKTLAKPFVKRKAAKAGASAFSKLKGNVKLRNEILGSMKDGGMVKKTGAYVLHEGEKVVPKKRLYAKYPK